LYIVCRKKDLWLVWLGRWWCLCIVGFVVDLLFVFLGLQWFGMYFSIYVLDQRL